MKSQFDARQLEKIIKIAANSSECPEDSIGRVEFIWLDIACIDQSKIRGERVDEYFSEIGRQANICRGANHVFAWLHSFSSWQFSEYIVNLDDLVDRMTTEQYGAGSTKTGREGWAIDIRTSLSELTQDPWFTSLWTLQDGFLSSDARILCSDGWELRTNFVRLGRISFYWNIIYGIVERSHSMGHVELNGLKEDITKLGFLEATRGQNIQTHLQNQPGRGNSLFLLTASYHRTVRAENINDKIYGIMQVYDLKLGKSSPRHKAGTEYSLEDLEDQLGAEILAKFPIASQLVVQSGNCPSGKAWRVNSDMIVPPVALTYWKKMVSRSIDALGSSPSARLVAERNPSTGALWVRFNGCTSLLDLLLQHARNAAGRIAKVHSFPLMQVEFDEAWVSRIVLERGQQQVQSNIGLLTWLHETHDHRSPILLLLGRTCLPPEYVDPEEFEDLDWGISLILVRASGSSNSYVRVGFIIWKLSWLREFEQESGVILPHASKEYLDGHGDDWQVEEGFFE